MLAAGALTAGQDADLCPLAPGDSLVLDGTVPHRYVAEPEGADVVVILTSSATA